MIDEGDLPVQIYSAHSVAAETYAAGLLCVSRTSEVPKTTIADRYVTRGGCLARPHMRTSWTVSIVDLANVLSARSDSSANAESVLCPGPRVDPHIQ